ncbi:MAG: redoxin domain-containing protein [Polaromonas sp.]|nr:redoxin domain-containing protein [Polaromonas sp.]
MPFPLLADDKAEVAARYGAWPNWRVMKLAKRYTFLIDPSGKIVKTYLSVDTSRHSTEIVADLKPFNLETAVGCARASNCRFQDHRSRKLSFA